VNVIDLTTKIEKEKARKVDRRRKREKEREREFVENEH